MSTILVTGASGFLGRYVVPELLSAGHTVRALVRDDDARQSVLARANAGRDRVEFAAGDVTDAVTLGAAIRGVDAVVHLVAIDKDRNGGKDLDRINTQGTLNVISAAKEAGIRRLVHMGALGVVDDPRLLYARSKARAESAVAGSGLDWTTLKPSLMFGPGDGFFNIVATLLRIPVPVTGMPGNGRARYQPIAAADVARAVRLSLERRESVGQAYELGGPRHFTYRELMSEVMRAMGKRRLVLPIPLALVKVAARVAELLHLWFPASSDQLRQLALDNTTALDSVQRAFGFEPQPMEGSLAYLKRRKKDQ
jgi:NADH dehydrogenase